ncbi:MAG: hypothetical protein VX899_18225 [Myxococcota bacterium]|nr:hypothetical protein [Myxococcota bacterium]
MSLSDLQPGPIPVLVKTPDTGKSAPGQGQLVPVPVSQRGPKAAGVAFIALLLMVPPTIFFGPHVIITLPVGAVVAYVAWTIWSVDTKVEQIQVACPGCKKDTTLDGGKAADEMNDQCPECQRALTLYPGKES